MDSTKCPRILTLLAVATLLPEIHALADTVSPHVDRPEKVYSREMPNYSFYGTGSAGRMNEASMLRFEADQDMQDRKWDEGLRKISKAVELDPGDPSTHMLYAGILTGKLYSLKGPIDESLLSQCISEWRNLALHNADYIEQQEARFNWKRLAKIAKALDESKKKKLEEAELAEKQKQKDAQIAEKQSHKESRLAKKEHKEKQQVADTSDNKTE